MSKTKEEILRAKTAHEVFVWLKEDESHQIPEVFAYFDLLGKKEYQAYCKKIGCPEEVLWTPPNL